jgi:galactitol-specific phosphotransferase system IIB component
VCGDGVATSAVRHGAPENIAAAHVVVVEMPSCMSMTLEAELANLMM